MNVLTEVEANLLNGVDCLMLLPTAFASPERNTEADMIVYRRMCIFNQDKRRRS